jgi:hypothetical protein
VLYLISAFFCALRAFFRSRLDTSLEVLALRQQIAVTQTTATKTATDALRSVLLDHAEADLAAMVRRSGHREARNRDRMASGGFPSVLALAITATWWAAED